MRCDTSQAGSHSLKVAFGRRWSARTAHALLQPLCNLLISHGLQKKVGGLVDGTRTRLSMDHYNRAGRTAHGNRALSNKCNSLVVLLAAIQTALFGGGEGRALVFHQHGAYKLHIHRVEARQVGVAGSSAQFGHVLPSNSVVPFDQARVCATIIIHDFVPVPADDLSAALRDSLLTASAIDGAGLVGCNAAELIFTSPFIGSGSGSNDDAVRPMDIFASDLPLLI